LQSRARASSPAANARLLDQLDRLDAEIERRRHAAEQAEQEVERERHEQPERAVPRQPPRRPRWWHPKKQWPVPTEPEVAAAVERMMLDPIDGPGQVGAEWVEKFGMDGLGSLIAAWKARLAES
jgi:hypothetical protein